MRRYLPRFKLGRLLLAVAIATPLSAALGGYVTGFRCPLCFSGRIIPVFHGFPMCREGELASRGETPPRQAPDFSRWDPMVLSCLRTGVVRYAATDWSGRKCCQLFFAFGDLLEPLGASASGQKKSNRHHFCALQAQSTSARGRWSSPSPARPYPRPPPSAAAPVPGSGAGGRCGGPRCGRTRPACNPRRCRSSRPGAGAAAHPSSPGRAAADTPRASRAGTGRRRPSARACRRPARSG